MTSRRSAPRPLALVVALVASAVLATACGSSGKETSDVTTDGPVAISKVKRATVSSTDAEQAGKLIRHVAAELYGPLAEGADANVVYSPTSIALALSLLRTGGTGPSAQQLDRFLGSKDAASLGRAMNALDRALADRNGKREAADSKEGTVALRSANALWGQEGIDWEQPFLDALARDYGAGMRLVDYGKGDTARQAINAWVGEHTNGKIPELIPAGALDAASRLTLTNALYFKAPWNRELTKAGDQPFTTADGTKVQAPAMRTQSSFAYAEGDGYQAVDLPYAGGELAMTVIVPDGTDGLPGGLSEDLLDALLTPQDFEPREVRLTMPTFDLRTKTLLNEALAAAGVTAPFDDTTKDFEPMSSDPKAQPLYVANVRHEATITVDEKGTEAAAATSVEMRAGSAFQQPQEPVVLDVDRPFLFVVHDVQTGTPLFVGKVGNPLEK